MILNIDLIDIQINFIKMVNSLNARRGANTITNKKMTKEEYINLKSDKRQEYCLLTSEYFEYFDETDPKIMNYKQKYYLDIAAQIALNSDMNHKHGAVIVYKKNIIAIGYNYYYRNSSIHAEIAAICQLKGKEKEVLQHCELYVVRIAPKKFNNILKYSKPCDNCQNYINKKSIKKIYYSTNYEYDYTRQYLIYN
jgi:deoxycytidylate deaminase